MEVYEMNRHSLRLGDDGGSKPASTHFTMGVDSTEHRRHDESREELLSSQKHPYSVGAGHTLSPKKHGWTTQLALPPQFWHRSWTMYLFCVAGIGFAIGHHAFYLSLEGSIVHGDDQLLMLRYGTALAFAAKASLAAAMVSAFREQAWATVRSRFLTVATLDKVFSAPQTPLSLLSLEFLRKAKVAAVLATFGWISPLIVILTTNTLVVEPAIETQKTACPGIRSLNFTFEATNDFRFTPKIEDFFEISLSIWNTTSLSSSDPDFFDYWTGKSWQSDEFLTSATFLQRPVTDPDETFKVCEKGWNCSAEITFVGPAYKCQEIARGVGATPRVLQQQSGNARLPFDFDLLAPKGNHTWIASATLGEYHDPQLKDVEPGGIPTFDPPFPKNLGAFRTEPVIWVGYAELVNTSIPPYLGERGRGFNAEAWRPNTFACEHYEARYTAELRYRDGVQLHVIKSRQLLDPILNTTFQGHIPAVDGTEDNTTATPEENYVLPRDTLKYRKTAAYHSLGLFLRNMINGTISEPNTNANSFVIQTGLIDQRLYNARPNMVSQLEKYYETLVLSMLAKPRFLPVVWASKPDEQTGIRDSGLGPKEDYMYPCQRERAAIKFYYRSRILFSVYGVAISFTILGVAAGALALRKNDGVPRNTDFSSIVAATRGSHLGKVPWDGVDGDSGGIPKEVMSMKMGYGRLRTAESNVVFQEEGDDRTDSPKPMPRSPEFGFGFEGDLDQTCGSKA